MRDVRAGGTGAYKVKRAWRVRVEVGCEMVLSQEFWSGKFWSGGPKF